MRRVEHGKSGIAPLGQDQAEAVARFEVATSNALDGGLSAEDLFFIFARVLEQRKVQPDYSWAIGEDAGQYETPHPTGELAATTELPDGLIAVPDAAQKYDIPKRTILSWIRQGRIACQGRIVKGRGAPRLVILEKEVLDYKDAPRSKGGRPTKR